jgi:diaminopimelate epimerase
VVDDMSRTTLVLEKFHGLGNDFLVLLDPDDAGVAVSDWAHLARSVCDRRRGVGADGLLVGRPGDGAWSMVLFNSDGSRAEISGNGIRCFAQALHGLGAADSFVIDTDAGRRVVEVLDVAGAAMTSSVGMGSVVRRGEPEGWEAIGCNPDRPVAHLDLGNPHSVVGVEDVDAVDLAAIGSQVPGVNLEIVEPGAGRHEVRMRVHERGAGITEACGSGACATAFAALDWGLVAADPDGAVTVHMDGGTVRVRVVGPEVTLIGPSVRIGRIEVEVGIDPVGDGGSGGM